MATGRRKKRTIYRKRHQNKFSMFLVTMVVVMILVVVAIKRVEIREKMETNQLRIEQLNEEIAEEENRSDKIKKYEKYTHTKAFAEEIAHDKLGLVYEGEIIFKEE